MSAHRLQADIDNYVATTGLSLDLGGAASNAVVADVISERTSATGVTVDGVLLKDSTVKTDTIIEKTSAAGVTIDDCLIKDGRAALLATASFFRSTEQTGTGSSQDVAHGLGTTPTAVLASFSELDGNAADMAYGTHDATNCKFTVTSGAKFFVLAFK